MLVVEAFRNRFQYGVRLDVSVYRNLRLELVLAFKLFLVELTSKPSCLERLMQRVSSLTPPPFVN
jgi:hypothetical protein